MFVTESTNATGSLMDACMLSFQILILKMHLLP